MTSCGQPEEAEEVQRAVEDEQVLAYLLSTREDASDVVDPKTAMMDRLREAKLPVERLSDEYMKVRLHAAWGVARRGGGARGEPCWWITWVLCDADAEPEPRLAALHAPLRPGQD